MSLLSSGSSWGRFEAPPMTRPGRQAWRRLPGVVLAVALNVAAVLLLVSQGLTGAWVGVALATLGWLATGRLAARDPRERSRDRHEPDH
jgi:hypothetical protein